MSSLDLNPAAKSRINLNEPRWDQSTYSGRVKHFFMVTNPLNLFCSSKQLDKSKEIITKYKNGEDIPNLNTDTLWRYKHIYDSAHHPETGERQFLIGRMSAQVPMNMLLTGCMLTFYKTNGQIFFWQWFNQSFNALVNYTNKSGDTAISTKQLTTSYLLATSGALTTSLGLNRLVKNAPPILSRFVPFCAVAAANSVNIPMMRIQELREGITIVNKNGEKVGKSKKAAKYSITQVVCSRIGMAAPGMLLPPILMNKLEQKGLLKKIPWINAPLQVVICGIFLIFTTPLCCALFPQKASIHFNDLEPELQIKLKNQNINDNVFYYNKGL